MFGRSGEGGNTNRGDVGTAFWTALASGLLIIGHDPGDMTAAGDIGADAVAAVYAENDYNIQAKLVGTNKIQFLIEFRDDDAGDQQDVPEGEIGPAGAAEDEDVGGTTTSTISAYVPDSSFTYNGSTITAVHFPDPTCAVNSSLE